MATKIFQLTKKVGGVPFFSRMILHTPPLFGNRKHLSPFDIPPLLDDNQNFLIVERGGACAIIFGKEKIVPTSPIRQPKNFNRHSMVLVC
jgi:hypothetical protein